MRELIEAAQQGDRESLEAVIQLVQDKVYELALRMLGHPQDAEDAAQEILIKVITKLGGFRGESALTTWVFRIAANHLMTTRKRRMERMGLSFEMFERSIERQGPIPETSRDPEQRLLMTEQRSNCMQAIAICLDRDQRLAFILGDVFGLSGQEGAGILEIEPATFRKRTSRARERIRAFMAGNCGLVNPDAPCHCTRQIPADMARGWLDSTKLVFASSGSAGDDPCPALDELEVPERVAALFETYPVFETPDRFAGLVRKIFTGRKT